MAQGLAIVVEKKLVLSILHKPKHKPFLFAHLQKWKFTRLNSIGFVMALKTNQIPDNHEKEC